MAIRALNSALDAEVLLKGGVKGEGCIKIRSEDLVRFVPGLARETIRSIRFLIFLSSAIKVLFKFWLFLLLTTTVGTTHNTFQ